MPIGRGFSAPIMKTCIILNLQSCTGCCQCRDQRLETDEANLETELELESVQVVSEIFNRQGIKSRNLKVSKASEN